MEQMDIEKQFVNQVNQYYAHGIGEYDEKVIKSIFENGLRCSHNELYWTADISFYESDGDVSIDKERIESIVFSLSLLVDELLCYIGADTEIIKSSFLGKVKPGRRRVIKRDIGGCKF